MTGAEATTSTAPPSDQVVKEGRSAELSPKGLPPQRHVAMDQQTVGSLSLGDLQLQRVSEPPTLVSLLIPAHILSLMIHSILYLQTTTSSPSDSPPERTNTEKSKTSDVYPDVSAFTPPPPSTQVPEAPVTTPPPPPPEPEDAPPRRRVVLDKKASNRLILGSLGGLQRVLRDQAQASVSFLFFFLVSQRSQSHGPWSSSA